MKATVKKVFVAGGMPTITYVGREELKLELALRDQLDEGYKITCVTGPTKSGKTVLCRRVLTDTKSVWIEGGQVTSKEELWMQLASELHIFVDESEVDTVAIRAGVSAIAKAEINSTIQKQKSRQNNVKKMALNHLLADEITLVIDDFHYLDAEIQLDIVQSVKSAVFDGLEVILIAVPHRAFDAITAERELEGRFAQVEIPPWDIPDLKKISKKGFTELNIGVSDTHQSKFATEAFGSPLLMQRFCHRLCSESDIKEKSRRRVDLDPEENDLERIFEYVAKQFGLPTFEKLSKGPQSRSKRMARHIVGSDEELDIYECVLRAVSNSGPKPKLHYNEIRDELRTLIVENDMPQKHEVSAALKQMSAIAKEKLAGEPVLEWADDILYLTDPFLMFYMKWMQKG